MTVSQRYPSKFIISNKCNQKRTILTIIQFSRIFSSNRSSRKANVRPSVCLFASSLSRALNLQRSLHTFLITLNASSPQLLGTIAPLATSRWSSGFMTAPDETRCQLLFCIKLFADIIHSDNCLSSADSLSL